MTYQPHQSEEVAVKPVALTKADTVALWHAVEALAWSVRVLPSITPPLAPEDIEAERATLTTARRALRKVNAIRRGKDTHA